MRSRSSTQAPMIDPMMPTVWKLWMLEGKHAGKTSHLS